MPILGVCWKFFCWNELSLTTYHYHLFLHPLVMAAFELAINYYHGIADATKAVLVVQLHVLFGNFWRLTYHPPPFLALTEPFGFCPP